MQQVAHLALALRQLGSWSASLAWRYIGPAPLTEHNSVRSASSQTTNLRVQRQVGSKVDLTLDVLNLGNRRNNDISYFYKSRLVGEPTAGLADVHVHPAEPRTLRLMARLRF
ncbi:MAG: hypothetical protein ACKOBF_01110 [Limnohabitans sp.]